MIMEIMFSIEKIDKGLTMNFLLSHHSISVFTVLIITLVIAIYLGTKRNKTIASKWLLCVFIGYVFLYLGYFLGYSIYSPIAAFHKYFTILVIFGMSSFIAFSYNYPRNDMPKESKFGIPLAFGFAFLGAIYYFWGTLGTEPYYHFHNHIYTFEAGSLINVQILILHIWCLFILVRKAIRYSETEGYFGKWLHKHRIKGGTSFNPLYFVMRFFSACEKYFYAKSKDAKSIKGFAKSVLLLMFVSILSLLNSAEIISHEIYAYLFSSVSLILSFYIIIIYLNNSPESTTFLVKLVGISLVTLLLVLGYVSNVTLSISETDYDNQHITEIKNLKKNILLGELNEGVSSSISYVVKRPANGGRFQGNYQLVYSQKSEFQIKELLSQEEMDKKRLMDKKFSLLVSNSKLTKEEAEILANQEINQYDIKVLERGYRKASNSYTTFEFLHENTLYEVGYNYLEYRKHTHNNAIKLFYIIIATTIGILVLFPKFFSESLVQPLDVLRIGMERVNNRNFDVVVPVLVRDEIGYLSDSFNTMVSSMKDMRTELEGYATNLEEKIRQRTKEMEDISQEAKQLKVQLDGDYFLTSLLAKPLFSNANKSKSILTDFVIRQKKQFEFRDKKAELGGDLCITGTLRFAKLDKDKKLNQVNDFILAMNGDASGKTLQGAGGSLIMGVVMNSIIARSSAKKNVLTISPEKWMSQIIEEIDAVFTAFGGSLIVSASIYLINENNGDSYYVNAGHPRAILYRDNQARFIEDSTNIFKFGIDKAGSLKVQKFPLKDGDVVFIGSDGKDSINLTPFDVMPTININEDKILRLIESSKGNLREIESEIFSMGDVTDDLSLLRIGYKENMSGVYFGDTLIETEEIKEEKFSPEEIEGFHKLYHEGRKLYNDGNIEKAIETLTKAFELNDKNQKLNKILGLLTFKGKQYEIAIKVLNKYLLQDPDNTEMWYYLSLAQKQIGNYIDSIDIAKKYYEQHPHNVQNIINLADLYRINGNIAEARVFVEKAIALDPANENALKILKILNVA